jgi:DNA-binding CsgD family transcriptional regulator
MPRAASVGTSPGDVSERHDPGADGGAEERVTVLELASRAPGSLSPRVEGPPSPSPPSGDSRSAPASRDAARGAFWVLAWPAALFLLITAFIAVDLAHDVARDAEPIHVHLEIVAFVIALGGVAGTTLHLRRALRRAGDLQKDLLGARVELERSRSEAEALLRRLGFAIEHHFDRWELTSAERSIALLVLKGLSYKEIASARGTTERTVRHQTLAIYRKARVAGRAELAAFFLQDLLVPSLPVETPAQREGDAP